MCGLMWVGRGVCWGDGCCIKSYILIQIIWAGGNVTLCGHRLIYHPNGELKLAQQL